ncbi:MAG: hypothetical protein ACU85U_07635 [Gammaproteobacteria bacterium]|jgi:phenylpropionate dioxygenase-like ring-hydroxylating dioxygenase large terminal subunit
MMIPDHAEVRTFPVVVRDSWVRVWIGDPAQADPDLICFAVGPEHPDWHFKTGEVRIDVNYCLEIANLMDLSHVAWVHSNTLGGTSCWFTADEQHTMTERRHHGILDGESRTAGVLSPCVSAGREVRHARRRRNDAAVEFHPALSRLDPGHGRKWQGAGAAAARQLFLASRDPA